MKEDIPMTEQEWEKFYESQGSGYFRLESEILRAHGDDQKKLLYELFGSTKTLVQTIGVVAGFGFTGLGYVKSLPLFIGGEFFLLITILVGLFWTRQAYKSNLESSLAEVKKVKGLFAERFSIFKKIYDKALVDIGDGKDISIPRSQIVDLQKSNNDFLKKFTTEQEPAKSETDPFGWLMLCFAIGGLLLLSSFVQFCSNSKESSSFHNYSQERAKVSEVFLIFN
jgi:hypothetical protein